MAGRGITQCLTQFFTDVSSGSFGVENYFVYAVVQSPIFYFGTMLDEGILVSRFFERIELADEYNITGFQQRIVLSALELVHVDMRLIDAHSLWKLRFVARLHFYIYNCLVVSQVSVQTDGASV